MLRINNGGKIVSSSSGIGIIGYLHIKEWNWSLFLFYKKNGLKNQMLRHETEKLLD